jgi:hypothetical protein
MTMLYDVGDGIMGEKISCEFRKASKSTVIRKTAGAMRVFIHSWFALQVLC